jgi:hypothetical protein
MTANDNYINNQPLGSEIKMNMKTRTSTTPTTLNVRATKKEMQIDPDVRAYEEKPLTGKFKPRRKMTVDEIGKREAQMCGGGRFNF